MRNQFKAWSSYMQDAEGDDDGEREDSGATRAIPSAGPDFEHLLAQEVVIEAGDAGADRRAAIAPDHSPRARAGTVDSAADALPQPGLVAAGDLQREVEQFLYRQAELLDGKHWQAFIDLFADERRLLDAGDARADRVGRLAVDLRRGQADDGDPEGPRLASERAGRRRRCGRPTTSSATSRSSRATATTIDVRSRFHMMELRRDAVRHFGGTLPPHAGARRRAARCSIQPAARRPVQRPGAVRLRAADLGLTRRLARPC